MNQDKQIDRKNQDNQHNPENQETQENLGKHIIHENNRKKIKNAKKAEAAAIAQEIHQLAIRVYLLLIFLMFPLYLENRYQEMALCKWRFYLFATVSFLSLTALCALVRMAGFRPAELRRAGRRPGFGVCDWMVGIYGGCVLLSFFLCADRQRAWTGAEGWYMGAAAQLLFVLSYFVISRSKISVSWLIGCNAAGSGLCFLIGILQRLGMDFLGLYRGMADVELSDYLSTIGNRTWMSGYACAVFPIGVSIFWRLVGETNRESTERIIFWGFYTLLGFAGLGTTYSDSAYVGLAMVLLALGILSVGDGRKILAFLEVLCLWFASNLLMCGLRWVFADGVRDERGVTTLIYRPGPMLVGLCFCGAFCVLVRSRNSRRQSGQSGRDVQREQIAAMPGAETAEKRKRRWQRICLEQAVAAAALNILFVVLNTTGILERIFHVTVRNPYLYFDENWGDMRGWIWRKVCEMFGELSVPQKLFGVGADCFASYAYSSLEYAAEFSRIWGDAILTNAHNEWLNMLFCQGIIGGLAYLGIFVSAACLCLRKASEQANPVVAGIGLCVLAYMAHDFFCYQQICAAGPVFILIGAAASVSEASAL